MPDSVEQVFTSLGGGIQTGEALSLGLCASELSPCRRAYEHWDLVKKKGGYSQFIAKQFFGAGSWDTLAILLAVRGETATHLKTTDKGYYMEVDEAGHEFF